MLKHYFKISLRNLLRQKMLALINILGLSIGLACFSLFLLYTVNEFSFDRFNTKATRIYRVYDWWSFSDHEGSEPSSATPLGPAMKQDLSDVEDFVRINSAGEKLIRIGNQIHRIKVSFADPQLFSVFTFPLIAGNTSTALESPTSITLTREKAIQLFGKTDVVGQTVEIRIGNQFEPFEVGAVAENIPVNSSIRFDILGNFDYILNTEYGKASLNDWNMTIGISVYVLLHENSNLMNEPARMASLRQKYFPNETEKNNAGNPTNGFGLQPITEVHTGVKIDKWGASDPKNSWILMSIAIGVLLIACINFITLAISRSAGRSKEVGIRKVTGGHRYQLVYQFLSESFLMSMISAIIGLILAYTLLPFFNELSGRSLSFSFTQYPEMIGILSGVVLLVGLISGIYPAFAISGLQPSEALKGKLKFSGSNFFTKSLVSFQFVLSIGLIISMIVFMRQLGFMQSKDLGFDKENVVTINTQDIDLQKDYPIFKQILKSESSILGVTSSSIGLGNDEGQMGRRYKFDNKEETVIEYPVDSEFLNVLSMQLIAGRTFNPTIASDATTSVVVNEALVHDVLGITAEEALGKEFTSGKGTDRKVIIGVSRNFNFEDLTRTVRAQMFLCPADFKPNSLFVRINPGDPSKALAAISAAWKNISPDLPMKYNFLAQKFDDFYKEEKRWGRIVSWVGAICIFLACMGLVGLTSLAVINRSTEIGIRKINGAKVSEVMILLNRDFVKWVAIAFIIAIPIAYYAMQKWLESFAYKTELSWWIFALAGLLALGIALITVSYQSWKAATRNPVEALRYE
jgi:putative ABC transport system permease protein